MGIPEDRSEEVRFRIKCKVKGEGVCTNRGNSSMRASVPWQRWRKARVK